MPALRRAVAAVLLVTAAHAQDNPNFNFAPGGFGGSGDEDVTTKEHQCEVCHAIMDNLLEKTGRRLDREGVEGWLDSDPCAFHHFKKYKHIPPTMIKACRYFLEKHEDFADTAVAAGEKDTSDEPEYWGCYKLTKLCRGVEYDRKGYTDRMTLKRELRGRIEEMEAYLGEQNLHRWGEELLDRHAPEMVAAAKAALATAQEWYTAHRKKPVTQDKVKAAQVALEEGMEAIVSVKEAIAQRKKLREFLSARSQQLEVEQKERETGEGDSTPFSGQWKITPIWLRAKAKLGTMLATAEEWVEEHTDASKEDFLAKEKEVQDLFKKYQYKRDSGGYELSDEELAEKKAKKKARKKNRNKKTKGKKKGGAQKEEL